MPQEAKTCTLAGLRNIFIHLQKMKSTAAIKNFSGRDILRYYHLSAGSSLSHAALPPSLMPDSYRAAVYIVSSILFIKQKENLVLSLLFKTGNFANHLLSILFLGAVLGQEFNGP